MRIEEGLVYYEELGVRGGGRGECSSNAFEEDRLRLGLGGSLQFVHRSIILTFMVSEHNSVTDSAVHL
jgi:hypothetical protein